LLSELYESKEFDVLFPCSTPKTSMKKISEIILQG